MGGANTDVESLENVLRAVEGFQNETYTFSWLSKGALLEFDEMVGAEMRRIADILDEGSRRRPGDAGNSEMDQMLYEYESSNRRQLAGVEAYYSDLSALVKEYEACRDAFYAQLVRLMQGETMGGNAHGLNEVISLLQEYLSYR